MWMSGHRNQHFGMYQGELPIARTITILFQERMCCDRLLRGEHQDVLAIERKDGVVRPDEWADAVDREIAVLAEECSPVVGPLFVDVIGSSLVRNCRREEDAGSMLDDVAHELSGAALWEMLGDLE